MTSADVLHRSSLPQPLTSLVGRKQEIAAVAHLIQDAGARLVTLTGPGGIGKTRLALAAAGRLGDQVPDGAWFVSLSPIADPDLVVPTIARVLGIDDPADQPLSERLTGYLRERKILLVLDNFEHVVTASTAISHLLAACPALSILVTSREPLRLSGEHEYPVPPLDILQPFSSGDGVPLPDGDAIRLFVDRAQHGDPGFTMTEANAPVIVEICRRLDGLPLALELAAARIKLLSPEDLLERLDEPLSLLTGGPRDVPERQQTMRATLQWSYDLLSPGEQRLFQRLAVFFRGWTLAAAEAVMGEGAVLELLASLVDKGLVRRVDPPGRSTRYGMLEPVRQFAWECLEAGGEDVETIRDQHAGYYLSIIDGLRKRMDEADGPALFERVETEHDNLRAALRWLRESGQIDQSLRLVGHLAPFWLQRGYINEGWTYAEAVLSASGTARRTSEGARALWMAGWLLLNRGEVRPALRLSNEACAISEEHGDRAALAESLFVRGICHDRLGHDEQARSDYECALALFREVADDAMAVRVLNHLGNLTNRQGDLRRARALLEEGLGVARSRRLLNVLALTLGSLGDVATQTGNDRWAAELLGETVRLYDQLGKPQQLAGTFDQIAHLIQRQRQAEAAACLYAAAARLRETTGSPYPLLKLPSNLDAELSALRTALPATVFEAAWERGRAIDVEQAIDLALQALESGRAETAAAPPAGLTPREVEVLRLIAAGKSNRQIASELFLSSRTVERHVANIYAKIDAHNRAGATAFALGHNLA